MSDRWVTVVLVSAALLVGCDRDEANIARYHPDRFGFEAGLQETRRAEGKLAFRRYCVGCHGEKGDGQGKAAVFFDPKPRDFVKADFKFSSTRSGQLPLDSDLKRTLRYGLKGSAMPPFDLLPDRTVDALIAYIKTFSPKWQDRDPARAVPLVDDPYRPDPDKSAAIARGELVFHGFATCWTCHPAFVSAEKINAYRQAVGAPVIETFRQKLHESVGKPNTRGEMIYPPDFLRDFVRAGASVDDLYRSIAAGITGTAMPTWVDSISVPGQTPDDPPRVEPSDLWAIAYYVQSLIAQRPDKLTEGRVVIRERLPKRIYLHGPPPAPPTPAVEEEDEEMEVAPEDLEDEFEG